MYSILIAEDEGYMREALVHANFWEQCGITGIFECSNGVEALQIIRSEKIDFLLSDIRMPLMNGLELLAKVKEETPEIEVVLLTGFDEFDYVRMAMRLGAYDYLLKPIKDEELLQLFLKLTYLKSEKQIEQYKHAMEQTKWKQSQALLQEQFLAERFSGKITDHNVIQHKSKTMEISWKPEAFIFILIEVDQLHVLLEQYSARDLELLQYGVRNIVEEYLRDTGWQYYIFAVLERLGIWCEAKAEESVVEALLGRIRQSVKRFIKVTVSIGISRKHGGDDEAFESYIEAMHSLKMKMYLGKDQTYFFEKVRFEEDKQLFNRELQQRLHNYVAAGNEEEMSAMLEDLFSDMRAKKTPAPQVDQILLLMMQIYWENKVGVKPLQTFESFHEERLSKIRTFDTIEEIQGYIVSCFLQVTRDTVDKRKNNKSKLISDILLFIEEHYMNEISLQVLSDKFFINPSYLSRLFKEEVGQIFTKYIMQLRIQKAQVLLKTTRMRVYEVSEAIGYSDVKYFNKIFKDLTGLTPADFRNS
jgi:two-component system response regulator YesN